MIVEQKTRIGIRGPFSLKATALSHGWHELTPLTWSEGGRCLQVVFRYGDTPCRVSLTQAGRSIDRAKLNVVAEGRNLEPGAIDHFVAQVERMLSLKDDMGEFYALCADHPSLSVIPKLGAGRVMCSPSMTENIVKAICGTNNTWTQAVKSANRIGQLGPHFPHFRHYTAWPTEKEILRAGEKFMKEVARVGYRGESILAVCRARDEGPFDPESLWDLPAETPYDEIKKKLTSLPGIGPITAAYLMSFLGRHDHVSIDSATITHVADVHMKGRRPTVKQVERIYAKYGKWKNLVYWLESWVRWDTAQSLINDL